MSAGRRPILYAILAALCYGLSAPVSKLLLTEVSPVLLASLLYLGAGGGMGILSFFRNRQREGGEARITKKDFPYVAAMVMLDVAAPIFLMVGLTLTTPATASLLNNFEIAATAVIALVLFKEAVGRRMWLAILFITLGSAVLSLSDGSTLAFSPGALLVVLACVFWGLENNCTRMLSLKSPLEIVTIKGLGSGAASLVIALISGAKLPPIPYLLLALLLGLVSYGLSISFYILAQRSLGAARTSAYYAFAPFIGSALSFAVFGETPGLAFLLALPMMLLGAYLAAHEKHSHLHSHEAAEHDHRHSHADGHHTHGHIPQVTGEHSHPHVHEPVVHKHPHTPDMHHLHPH